MDRETIYIRQVIEGDLNRFAYFVEQYQDMAFVTALGILGNSEDAEEAVQDAFMRAFRGLSSFRAQSKFSTWLCRIVINVALSRSKKKPLSKYVEDLDLAEELAVDIESAYERLNAADRARYIRHALERLNPEDRSILTLYYLNEQPIEEIAFILENTRDNIKMKLHRARKKMYNILSQELRLEKSSI